MSRAASLLDEVSHTGFGKGANQIQPDIPVVYASDRHADHHSRTSIMEVSTYFWLYDFEVSYLDPAGRKIWDLELHCDRSLALAPPRTTHASSEATGHATAVLVVAFDGRQAHFCAHEEFFASPELLDLPNDG